MLTKWACQGDLNKGEVMYCTCKYTFNCELNKMIWLFNATMAGKYTNSNKQSTYNKLLNNKWIMKQPKMRNITWHVATTEMHSDHIWRLIHSTDGQIEK